MTTWGFGKGTKKNDQATGNKRQKTSPKEHKVEGETQEGTAIWGVRRQAQLPRGFSS